MTTARRRTPPGTGPHVHADAHVESTTGSRAAGPAGRSRSPGGTFAPVGGHTAGLQVVHARDPPRRSGTTSRRDADGGDRAGGLAAGAGERAGMRRSGSAGRHGRGTIQWSRLRTSRRPVPRHRSLRGRCPRRRRAGQRPDHARCRDTTVAEAAAPTPDDAFRHLPVVVEDDVVGVSIRRLAEVSGEPALRRSRRGLTSCRTASVAFATGYEGEWRAQRRRRLPLVQERATVCRSPRPVTRGAHIAMSLCWLVDVDEAHFGPALKTPRACYCGSVGRMVRAVSGARSVFQRLATEFAGRLKVVRVDVDRCPLIARRYRETSIPMLLLMRAGDLLETVVGAQPEHALRQRIERLLEANCRPALPRSAPSAPISSRLETWHRDGCRRQAQHEAGSTAA